MCHHASAEGGRSVAAGFIVATMVTAMTLLSVEAGYGQALTEGPLSPSAVVDDSSFGIATWSMPDSASASDDAYAAVTPNGSPTHYLKATDFGFSIPTPAEILGIEVLVERHSALGTVVDSRARIVKGGVVGSAERALGGTWPDNLAGDAEVTYGSPSDLWGETWTPADINNTGFGFALSVDDMLDSAGVDHISIRVTYTLCATTPAVGCRTALKSVLVVKDNSNDFKDKVVWKWVKGQSTSTAEFGDPVMGTANIALCIYENSSLVAQLLVGPGAGWNPISTKGWKYLNKLGPQDGVQKIVLKASTNNKSKAIVKGKGLNLPTITPPLATPITTQLVNSESGICWEAVFNSTLKNQPGKLKAKFP